MKLRIFFILFLILPLIISAQKQAERQIKKFVNDISNEKLLYGITNFIPISDSNLKLPSNTKTVKIRDKKQRLFIEKYKNKLYPYLIELFDDPKKDWAVNVIFYNISKKNASGIEFMTENNIELWRKTKKDIDKSYWISFFENIQ